jgi:3-methyl-2-oxobutanoate hydroxymethyltransferase
MSVRPADPSSSTSNILSNPPRQKVTINELQRLRASNIPITVLTAYDYPSALLLERSQVDIVLVGDSLSQVALGHPNTTSITLDEMIHHAKAVTRGARTPFIIADMPFGSFEGSLEKGVEAVLRMVKEGGVDGVKIEGGDEIIPLVKRLAEIGIPVIPHLGLQPQRATMMSGYLVQGRQAENAVKLYQTAKRMEEAGAVAVLLEAIPHLVATHITDNLRIPTIGIGAGSGTSGQVLVITDILGIYADEGDVGKQPKFVRRFGDIGLQMRKAVGSYVAEVKSGGFPSVEESYGMKKGEWEGYLSRLGESPGKDDVGADKKLTDTEDGA